MDDNVPVVSFDINSVHSRLIHWPFEHILHAERVATIGK